MHSLTVWFGPAGAFCQLLYREEALARHGYLQVGHGDVTDDFGKKLKVSTEEVHAMLLEDLDQSQLGQVEIALHNARSQAKAQTRASTDPTLKTAAMTQGPAVFNGGMPGGRFS